MEKCNNDINLIDWSNIYYQMHALNKIGAHWYDGKIRNAYIADTCYELSKTIMEQCIIMELNNKENIMSKFEWLAVAVTWVALVTWAMCSI